MADIEPLSVPLELRDQYVEIRSLGLAELRYAAWRHLQQGIVRDRDAILAIHFGQIEECMQESREHYRLARRYQRLIDNDPHVMRILSMANDQDEIGYAFPKQGPGQDWTIIQLLCDEGLIAYSYDMSVGGRGDPLGGRKFQRRNIYKLTQRGRKLRDAERDRDTSGKGR